MKIIDNLLKKPLWVNLLTGIGAIVVLLVLFFFSLGFITGNGQTEKVPTVLGLDVIAAEKNLRALGFDVELQDSIYVDTLARNAVLRQTPEADEVVKKGRTVYLTVNRVIAPQVDMPNLIGFSLKSAETYLKVLGLRMGSITLIPDRNKNVVVDQMVNGQVIAPGSKIPSGTIIHFLVGDGGSLSTVSVPNLIGLTYEQAKSILMSTGLQLGLVLANGSIEDSASAFVVQQNPAYYSTQLDSLGMPIISLTFPGASIDLTIDKVAPIINNKDSIK